MCSKCGKPLDLSTSIELDEKNQKQITEQNEKIETLENSLKSLQNIIKTRDKAWEQAMINHLTEFEKKLQNPQFAKKLAEEAMQEMENGNFN
jgi:hypothetical protein